MKYLLLLITVALMSSAGTAAAAGSSASSALQSFYDRVDTLRANFQQTQVDGDGAVVQKSAGLFLLKRPGQFRWEYDTPYKQIMVSDGTTFRFYDVGLSQVTVRAVGQTLKSTPAVLLTGGAQLEKQFQVSPQGKHDGLTWVRLIPRSQTSDFKQIRIGLHKGVPRRMEMDDRLGQTTNVVFTHIRVNEKIPDNRFVLDVPDDVDIVNAGDLLSQ